VSAAINHARLAKVAVSHSFTVLSALPVARVPPMGLNGVPGLVTSHSLRCIPAARGENTPVGTARISTTRRASATQEPAALSERVRLALESGDVDAITGLLDPGARWGAPEGPADADCRSRDQVIAWWAGARAAGARAVATEATAGDGGAPLARLHPMPIP
jgi:hypothetical protein